MNKKAIFPLIGIIFLIVIAILAIKFVPLGQFGLVLFPQPDVEFAGFTWQDTFDNSDPNCNSGGGSSSLEKGVEDLTLSSSASNNAASRYISTDITDIDEILVVYEGYAQATCSAGKSNAGAGISGQIRGTESGAISLSEGIGTSSCPSSGSSVSSVFKPSIWKFKNNFDGTWSTLQGLGVGDIFIVKSRGNIQGGAILSIGTSAGNGCGNGGSGQARIKIYNLVRKENAFALCKADEFVQDVNKDGKIASDGSECFDLQTIVLNSEEAIKESYDEKIARITAELQAKNAGLTADIASLKKQLAEQQTETQITSLQQQITELEAQLASAQDKTTIQRQIDDLRQQQLESTNLQDRVSALEAELKETKSTFNSVQAGNKEVIVVIENQEKFEKPNIVKRFFNAIIAWFKGLV